MSKCAKKICFLIFTLVLMSVTLKMVTLTITEGNSEEDLETEILKSLYCQCGCHRIAYDCRTMDCSLYLEWKDRIERELAAGKTKEEIINGFVEDYGEQVLVKPSPPLPMWIWIIPIFASLAGAVIIYQYVRRRHRPRAQELESTKLEGNKDLTMLLKWKESNYSKNANKPPLFFI